MGWGRHTEAGSDGDSAWKLGNLAEEKGENMGLFGGGAN